MTKSFPLLFILLWSSAFISGKEIVNNASPFTALAFRFSIVAVGFFIYSYFKREKIINNLKNTSESISTGILFHGIYLKTHTTIAAGRICRNSVFQGLKMIRHRYTYDQFRF